MKTAVILILVLSLGPVSAKGQKPGKVEKDGQHSTVKLEQLVAGHLQEINGMYKLRVAEVTYDPGGYIGPHHHAGPGIRCVTAGELTYVQPDKTTIYRAGDCFFESGDISHTAQNRGDMPVALLNFLLLPGDWTGGSAIPVPQ